MLELPFVFLGGARQQDFISGAPEIMSSWGLKYYPLCGFDSGQVLNKRHVRKHGFGKADSCGFKEQGAKDPRTRCWLGYLSSPFSLSFFLGGGISFCAGGGCLSLIQVHLVLFLGPPVVFITRAMLNPIWTLARLCEATRARSVPQLQDVSSLPPKAAHCLPILVLFGVIYTSESMAYVLP